MKTIVFLFLVLGTAVAAPQKKEEKPLSVFVERLQLTPFYAELKYVSNLKPFREVQVFSYIDGNVETKYKNNGDYVKKGEPIAAIKNITPGYSYSNHIIKAPISGVITGFYQEVGSYIKKSPAVLAIADVTKWRVAVPMPQQDLSLLKDGKFKVLIRPQGTTALIPGRLHRVAPNIDPVLGTSLVEFVFAKKDLKDARFGMIAELRLQYNRVDSVGIDEKYLLESKSEKKKFVYVVKNDMTTERRYLEVGVNRDGKVQILAGLKPGELIVTQMPSWGIKKGRKVQPQNKVDDPVAKP